MLILVSGRSGWKALERRTSPQILVPMLDIKVDLMSDLWVFSGLDGLSEKEDSDGHRDESEEETTEHDGKRER
jgi:hypothetical protein